MEEQKDIFEHLQPRKIETPDTSYFSDLADSISSSQQKTKVIPLYRKTILWVSAAAAVIAFVLMINLKENSNEEVLLALNSIPSDDIRAYIDDNIEDFDTELIAEIVEESQIEPLEIVLPEEEQELSSTHVDESVLDLDGIDTEDILEYLEVEDIDYSDFERTDELFI